MMPFERFDAWRVCHDLAIAVYVVTKSYPKDERYGLVSQTRRAAFSAPANIAEGSAKRGKREFRRYLDISLGSLSELAYWLRLAHDVGILEDQTWHQLRDLRNRAGQVTWKLYRSMG